VTDLKTDEQMAVHALDTETIVVTGFVRAEGSLVLLSGVTEDNQEVILACERRYVADILTDVEAGLEPEALIPVYMIPIRPRLPSSTP
jgi:hypothetical protein